MHSFKELPPSNKEALSYNHILANNEPRSTEQATQCVVKILDAKYENANLPEAVKITAHI